MAAPGEGTPLLQGTTSLQVWLPASAHAQWLPERLEPQALTTPRLSSPLCNATKTHFIATPATSFAKPEASYQHSDSLTSRPCSDAPCAHKYGPPFLVFF